ncbi:MAG: phytanoyl-CoA dioxygenase family protein [Candidatus Eremiobacteraeota bacterium]|nr:phytanoyl-CoA dioxygenase family protein [Candidatus Eremiobacteraeota bacterium]
MQLTDAQIAQFDRDGFLRFENLFSSPEIGHIKEELARVSQVDSDAIIRERTGALRTVYRSHEPDGPTASSAFYRLARTPRFLRPAQQVLGDDELYIYHCKANIKPAIDGTVWLWHQDYGYWQHDGVPTPNMATFLVMLDDASEMSGCLYFIPGSHKGPVLPAYKDETTTSYPQWAIEKKTMIEVLANSPKPVAIEGGPGTAVLFHCKMIHGSGHNLAGHDRWHCYMAYNPSKNRPNPIPKNARPDYVVSQNYAPLQLTESDSLREPVPA